jgi:hypothetical protein
MTESLRALLAGAIDYAGMFPPAGQPLEQALAKYRQHRGGPEQWMLGRFVCPADLCVLAAMNFSKNDGCLAAIVPAAEDDGMFPNAIKGALAAIRDFPINRLIDTVEFRWPRALIASADSGLLETSMRMAAHEAAKTKSSPLTMFFECPAEKAHLKSDRLKLVSAGIRALAEYNKFASPEYSSAGFKLRCGGAGALAIPSSEEVAAAVSLCRDHGVFWKATAGLHHPFRHVDPELGNSVHGFVNLLTAAVMADVYRLEPERVQAILDDDDPAHFHFTDRALMWCELSATVPQITGARDRALRSFGSCSIDEPWQDLTVLGLI